MVTLLDKSHDRASRATYAAIELEYHNAQAEIAEMVCEGYRAIYGNEAEQLVGFQRSLDRLERAQWVQRWLYEPELLYATPWSFTAAGAEYRAELVSVPIFGFYWARLSWGGERDGTFKSVAHFDELRTAMQSVQNLSCTEFA